MSADAGRVLTGPRLPVPVPAEKSGRPGIRPRALRVPRVPRALRALRAPRALRGPAPGKAPLTSRCSPARHISCIFIRQAGI
jgi:hypothetical protein